MRNRLYYEKKDKWKFFTDFLLHYGLVMLGKEWLDQQNALPAFDQHPAYVWRKQAHAFMQRQARLPEGYFAATPNGPLAAVNNFYYDLFTVDDNGLLNDELLHRLRHRDQFQGALYELFVEATCLRAGFTSIREDEKGSVRKQVEFVAVHKATGQHVLVEAKSRHRAGVMAMPGQRHTSPDLNFRQLINKAIAKDPNNPLAIFVDTNLPPHRVPAFYAMRSHQPPVPSLAVSTLMDRIRRDHGGKDPCNLLVFRITLSTIPMTIGWHLAAVGAGSSPRYHAFRSIVMRRCSICSRVSTFMATCRHSSRPIGTCLNRVQGRKLFAFLPFQPVWRNELRQTISFRGPVNVAIVTPLSNLQTFATPAQKLTVILNRDRRTISRMPGRQPGARGCNELLYRAVRHMTPLPHPRRVLTSTGR